MHLRDRWFEARRTGAALGILSCTLLACARQPSGASEPANQGADAAPSESAARAEEAAGELVVEVRGMRNDRGRVLIALFRSAEGFPDERDKAYASAARPIREGRARYAVSPVPPGSVAVSMLHDENGNFEMDTNLLGIPSEGYGASRNPEPRLGPPRFEDARFVLEAGERAAVRIEIVYP